MNDKMIKRICIIEAVVAGILCVLGFLLFRINENVGMTMIMLGIFLFIMLPLITKNELINKMNINQLKKEEDDAKNYNIKEFYNYGSYFYKCISNILIENNKIYSELYDDNFPSFNIESMAIKALNDIKEQDQDPFIYVWTVEYFEKYIKSNSNTKACRYLKNKVFNLLGEGTLTQKQSTFEGNIIRIVVQVKDLIKVKIFNNCLVKYDSEKEGYGAKADNGDKASFSEKEMVKYYFYYVDSLVSAFSIAYLIFLSNNIQKIDNNTEFIKIVTKMLDDVKDKEVVYSKLFELFNEFYRLDFNYIREENNFKLFINLIESSKKKDNNKKIKKYIIENDNNITNREDFNNEIIGMIYSANEQVLSEEEIKDLIIEKIKILNINQISDLFYVLGKMNYYIDFYNREIKSNKLRNEKEKFLKGDFESLKNESEFKAEYYKIKTGAEFEKYLVKLLKKCGYEVEHTGKAGDQGCDLIAKNNNLVYCIQAKYYSSTLDNSPVQEIVGALKVYKGDKGVVISNSDFTKGAMELAKSNNVILINGSKLEKIIDYVFEKNNTNDDILDAIESL